MNIVLINHYAGSDQYGMEYRPYYLAKHWVKQGHNVYIIASSYSHLRVVQPECNKLFCRRVYNGINFIFIKGNAYKGNGVARVLNIFSFVFLLSFLWRYFLPKNNDVVIASSTYPIDIFPARRIAKRDHACLVFEPHDLWPTVLTEIGGMSHSNPFVRIMQTAEDYACKYSDLIISMHPQNIEHLETRGCERSKFHHIPNGIENIDWDSIPDLPEPHISRIREIKTKGHAILLYAGSVSQANGLEALIDAAILLKKERHKVTIVITGDGPEKIYLTKMANDKDVDNMTFLPKIEKKYIPALLSHADIAYVGFKPSPLYRFGISPNKLWDYMMAAKPIIMAIDSSNDPVSEAQCGITVKPGSASMIVNAVNNLLSLSEQRREELGNNGREYVLNNNLYSVLSKKFIDIVLKNRCIK